ncbi:MAG: response regulator [Caldimonas sp.]
MLVVDDDSFMRATLRHVFTNAGLAVETYASAADLLANADLHSRAVLMLDMAMPEMSGLELQALLHERGIDMPVIFLTGSSDIARAVTAMRNGAADFLEKPFDPALLVERVRQVLARKAATEAVPAPRPSTCDYARRLATLTVREREVLELMIVGKTSKMIARDLGGSFRTVEVHRTRVMAKMAAASLAELVRMSVEDEASV